MLALKMKESMVTISWGIEGLLIIVLALVVRERTFRLTGLGLLLLCVAKVFAIDAWRLAGFDRAITIVAVGAAVTAVSILYLKFQDSIRRYL